MKDNLRKWMCVDDKEQWPKGRALGTPKSSLLGSEVMSFTMKVINLSIMWKCKHWTARYVISKVMLRRIGSMPLSVMSKAANRSKSEHGNFPWSVLQRRQLVT